MIYTQLINCIRNSQKRVDISKEAFNAEDDHEGKLYTLSKFAALIVSILIYIIFQEYKKI